VEDADGRTKLRRREQRSGGCRREVGERAMQGAKDVGRWVGRAGAEFFCILIFS
jgi:hypothetical protein